MRKIGMILLNVICVICFILGFLFIFELLVLGTDTDF